MRIFSPLTVEKFTTPQSPPDQPILRGLGWDIDSPFSSNRGELFPIGSFGHTGFTGTSVWIDPVQPDVCDSADQQRASQRTGRPSLRCAAGWPRSSPRRLGADLPGVQITGYNETLTGAGIHREVARNGQVLTGLDVLEEAEFRSVSREKRSD